MKKLAWIALFLLSAAAWNAAAQNWDNSGNGLLKGTYYFREVFWIVGDNSGGLSEAVALYGTISFDGNGNYTISGAQVMDSANGAPQTYSASGTYSISASGYGSISSPIVKGDSIYGLVAQGIFVGSSTETGSGYNDLFVGAPLSSPPPSNATFNGAYNMVDLDFSDGTISGNRQSTFQLHPDGNGNIASVQVSGYIAGKGNTVVNQTISSRVPYFTSNGAYNVNFGGQLSSSNLIAGTKYFYTSPDGNFVFGGSPTAWDMILGVRQGSAAPNFSGLYYQAGVSIDNSQIGSGYINLSTLYGSLNEFSGGLLAHQRIFSVFNNNPEDYTYSDAVTKNSDGTYSDSYNKYYFGGSGSQGSTLGVGIGIWPNFGVTALLAAPSFSGTGPYIFPTGVLNAGSSAPFTAGLAPGELVSIYGTNLTTATTSDTTLPTQLGGVQVLVNGTLAPLYAVAHTASYDQVNAVIPLSVSGATIASIQVFSSGTGSNTVTNYLGMTAPGVFNSLALVPAVQHGADYSPVTSLHPAQVGETLLVYLTGLGTLDSSGNATNTIAAYIDGISATVSYAGSQSPVGGGYQLNVVVPSGVTSGTVFLDIAGPDTYNSEVAIPVGTSSGSTASMRRSPRMALPRVSRGARRAGETKSLRRP